VALPPLGYNVVNASLTPNLRVANYCHDFNAKFLVLSGEITVTRDNKPETFRAWQSCEVPANCMHAEQVGPEGVAYLSSGRRRNGVPLSREGFESDLGREGWEIVHGGRKTGFTEDIHAHNFDVRIMVHGGERVANIRPGRSLPDTGGLPARDESGTGRCRLYRWQG
jgi:hypothetical protein